MTESTRNDITAGRPPRRFGLQARLLAPVFAITALALFIAIFMVTSSAEKALLETAREKLLNAAATAATNIDLQIQRARVDIISASNVPDIQAVLDPSDAGNYQDREVFIDHANKLLALLGGASNSYETFYVTDSKGMTRACSMPSAVGTLDISNRVWFHQAMRGEDPVISAPFTSRITGDMLMAVAMRFSYAGHSGAMVGSLQLGKTIAPALQQSSREQFLTAIVTDTGQVVASVDDTYTGLDIKERNWFPFLLDSTEGYLTIRDSEEDKMLAFYRLPNASLLAVTLADTDELLGPARFVRYVGIVSLVLAFLAAYAAIYVALAPAIRYTRQLADKAYWIGAGDLRQSIPVSRDDELGDLAAALSVMLENLKKMIFRAEEATRAKSDFLARMSHEIRTPLNAIIGMAYLGLQGNDDPKHRNAFTKIHSAAENLLGIINDILDFSKIEAGRMELEAAPFSLRETLDSTIDLLRGRAESKGVGLTYGVADNIPDILVGDALRLSQVCINLCTNAVKFTEHGSVTVTADLQSREGDNVTVHFAVTDTGIGMSEEQRKNIFDAFSQADGSITRRFGGTGLGLAICKHLVALMHGQIWVESTPGAGSVFHFTIAVPVHAEQTARIAEQEESLPEIPDAEHARVLLVEDNELNQEIAVGLLDLMGITPVIANNGEEAVALCEEEDFDLIFMDIQMPVMDGLEATRRIRACEKPGAKIVPIIAMTANAMTGDRHKSLDVGMNDHVTKPISYAELVDTIRRWYSGKKME